MKDKKLTRIIEETEAEIIQLEMWDLYGGLSPKEEERWRHLNNRLNVLKTLADKRETK